MVAKGPDMMTGPNSTSATAVASASLKEAGSIITRGSSALSNSRSGTPLQSMRDEPWSGDNAPRTMLDHKIEEEDPEKIDLDDAIITTISTKTAHRVSMTPQRANTIRVRTSTSIIESLSRTGIATVVAEQAGIGILPDAASSRKSLRTESPQDEDLDLPIQGTPVSKSHPREVHSHGPYIDNRLSWLQFDFDSPTESDRPQTSDAAPGWKRLSWLDDRSHEDLYEELKKSPEEKNSVSLEARERAVKPLDMEKRGEELGWDLESNRSELRDKW